MIESKITVTLPGVLMTRHAAQIAQRMGAYQSRVLLRQGEMTVNAKSLMGLLSLAIREGQHISLIVDGEDEARAAQEITALLCP